MKTATRLKFAAFVSQIALVNGLSAPADPGNGTSKFNVAPNVEQKLEDRLRASSEFLQMVNVIPVTEQEGAVLGVGVSKSLAGRTDTSDGTRRDPQAVGNADEKHRYLCKKTNFDWSMRYALLDAWAHRPNFQTLVRDDILAQQALDRIINFFPADRQQQVWMDLSLNLKAIVAQQLIPTPDGKGRRAAIEVLLNTPLAADMIRKGEVHELKPLMARSNELGMQTFDQALYKLYSSGEITYEDALAHADSANDLRLMIKLGSETDGKHLMQDQQEAGFSLEEEEDMVPRNRR